MDYKELIFEAQKSAPWIKIAYKDMKDNVHRIPGDKSHPRILEYWQNTDFDPRDDSSSWCAAGMNTFLKESGYQGTNSPAARSFLELPHLKSFRPGCICVFTRKGPNDWQAHVTIGLLKDDFTNTIVCLGANQNEKVCIKEFSQDKLLGWVWPKKIGG